MPSAGLLATPPTIVFNNIPASNAGKKNSFSFPMFTAPSGLIADINFRLDADLSGLHKQGMDHGHGSMECFGRQPHPAGWNIQQGFEKADVFRRMDSILQMVQPRPGLAPRGSR